MLLYQVWVRWICGAMGAEERRGRMGEGPGEEWGLDEGDDEGEC